MIINKPEIEILLGKVFKKIEITENEGAVIFHTENELFEMSHSQDCCENVYLDDIDGEIDILLDAPILFAEEVINRNESPEELKNKINEWCESYTWTFYKIGTIKGSLTFRWFGESNGYYSENITVWKIK